MNGKHWGSPTSKNIQDLQNLHYKVCKMYVNKIPYFYYIFTSILGTN